MVESQVKEVEREDLECIEAEFVTITQSTVRSVEGGHVELQQVGALSIDGERIEVTQGAATIIRGSDITLNQSMSVVTVGNTNHIQYSCSPVSIATGSVLVSRSAVGILGAREIKAESSSALIMIANSVEGEVTTLLDWRSALALGAVVSGALGLISLFRRK